ncbi:MAG: hypothetical protein WDZ89_02545 [Gemmatimonadota bacterium]
MTGVLLLGAALVACGDRDPVSPGGGSPAAPQNLEASYYNRAVQLTWTLGSGWDNDSFRVYGKRVSDASYFLVAEVTNCSGGSCEYTDVNIAPDVTYEYYVAAVDPISGLETASAFSVEVFVPQPVPPPVPGQLEGVALDNAVYLRWNSDARGAEDFSHYRVYFAGSTDFLMGETDSEGFLDLLAQNGETYDYFVTAVDDQGHESEGSPLAGATPRPDYHGEFMYAWEDVPEQSGFRFRSDESIDPIVDGASSQRHFRLELDGTGWYLVPGPSAEVHADGWETTALKCGPASDAGCVDLDVAPSSGYSGNEIQLQPQTTYVMRYIGEDGQTRYGVIRTTMMGFDQESNGIMIFDWAHQTQPGNRNLSTIVDTPTF